jgi:hypothetical protein
MRRTIGNEKNDDISPHNTHYHMIDSNTFTFPRTNTTDLNSLSPKSILRSQGREKNETPEIIQLHQNSSSLNGLSNPCYFASYHDTIDRFDMEQQQQQQQQMDNRIRMSLRGGQNNNNNNNSSEEREDTKF